ncbi:MAG TPA: DUF1345 domain-containing protein [Thermomicrobiales bacterium]|nr:DUF1345 domain-containing protein [Thermomicrobiales bacterium]
MGGTLGIVSGKFLLLTSFTLAHAASHYLDRGLHFEDEDEPDIFDFVYFSFAIGASFSSGTARVTNRWIRRIILVHSLLTSAFNTVHLGLVVTFLAR